MFWSPVVSENLLPPLPTRMSLYLLSVALHTAVYQRKAELDQIVKGLEDASVLDMIRRCPDIFRPLFVKSTASLSAGVSGDYSTSFLDA